MSEMMRSATSARQFRKRPLSKAKLQGRAT